MQQTGLFSLRLDGDRRAPCHEPFSAAMLQQLGISSFIRLLGRRCNTPEEIERVPETTAGLADAWGGVQIRVHVWDRDGQETG